jgi:ParB-like chromosome segregation protein Spo0J
MSEVKQVRLTSLHANPHRNQATYPLMKEKVDTLKRSIDDVGLWPSIIARQSNPGYEIAFGHHRVEAANQAGLKTVPVIVMELDDDQMLQYMGRENGEDYKADFLIMLNTWDAAVAHLGGGSDVEIARMLGWLRKDRINDTASACASAAKLIADKHMKRSDLKGLSVFNAREICQHAVNRMRQVEAMAKRTGRPHAEVQEAKRKIATGARRVAGKVNVPGKERVLTRDIRGAQDVATYELARQSKKQTPLFRAFADNVLKSIGKMLATDSVAEKLQMVVESRGQLQMDEDIRAVRLMEVELDELGKRARAWSAKVGGRKAQVVDLKALTGGAA